VKNISKKLKTILIDIAGIILIILSGLLGWLPGPGGIPLLIAGLSLLSINHDWAQRWLMLIKEHGLKISDKLFNGSKKTNIIVDIIGILFLAAAVVVMALVTQSVFKTAAIWLIIVSAVLLLGNKDRYKKIKRKR
jgi:uncharacterized membrane protein YkgB